MPMLLYTGISRFSGTFYLFSCQFQLNLGKIGNARLKISLLKLDHVRSDRAK